MHFKLVMEKDGKPLTWRSEAATVEDGIEQFELAVLAGEITKPEGLEERGYQSIEIGWAEDLNPWD
jgi:hypothetical protein